MNVTDQAISTIKAMIAAGELRPGSRLPRLEELALQLGLSRNSLREAVRALTTMNILVSRQGDGTYVSNLGVSALFEAVVSAADALPGDTLLQFLRLREIVEPPAVALATQRGTEADLHRLQAAIDELVPGADPDDVAAADLAFHQHLLEMSGDPALGALVRVLSPRAAHVRVLCGRRDGPAVGWVRDDHERILRAVASRDLEAARAAASVHISGMRQRLEDDLLSVAFPAAVPA